MTYVNLLAILGAAAYLSLSLRLYRPGLKLRNGIFTFGLILLPLTASWITISDLGFIRLLSVSGFLYHFCAWNRAASRRQIHLPMASLCLALPSFNLALPSFNLALPSVYQTGSALSGTAFGFWLLTWFLSTALGWIFTWKKGGSSHSVLNKATLVLGMAAMLWVPMQFFFRASPRPMLSQDNPGKDFYTLTFPEPHWLGDRIPEGVNAAQGEFWYWKTGWQQALSHPGKAFQNWRANINRMVFDFPYTFSTGKPATTGTGNRAFGSAGLFLSYCLSLVAWWHGRHRVPGELHLIVVWTLSSLVLRSLFCAGSAAVLPWIPSLLFTVALTFGYLLEIQFLKRDQSSPHLAR